jgi:hypothetical protein
MPEEKKATTRRAAAKKTSTPRKPAPKKTEAVDEDKLREAGLDPAQVKNDPQPEASKPPTDVEAASELLNKTIQQQQDKLNTYNALKEKGLPIPAELRAEVEPTLQQNVEQGPVYVRNLNHTMFRFKLDKHTPAQRGIVLQARGNRGDLSPVEQADLNDRNLRVNVELGLIELITANEAAEVVSKQTTNQQAVHPALSALRNEKGEEYAANAVSMGPSPDEQAITVAKLEDGQIVVDRTGIRDRVRGEAPGTPDYVGGAEPQHRPANEDPAFLSDLRARQKTANPADGMNVSIEPTIRTGGNPAIISDGFKGNQ